MDRAVTVHMLIIIGAGDRNLFNGLVVIQAETAAVSQVFCTVIGIIHMGQAYRHQAASHGKSLVGKDQVSVVIVYISGSRAPYILGMVRPIILNTCIIYIRNLDPWPHILKTVITVRGKKFRVTGQFIGILQHQSIVVSILIPVLDQTGNI